MTYVEQTVRAQEGPTSSAKRLTSLDAFRGLTIFGMLLVNNAALDTATPRHLVHAEWNQGVHFADMVFPWFLLIVGVAIPYASASRRRKGLSKSSYWLKALGRAASLVLLGCLIDSSLAKQPVVGLGVLQLIGLAYMVGALLSDLPVAVRVALASALLVGHWALLRYLPVPGVGAGVFTEQANAIAYLNAQYLQAYHLKGLVSVVPTGALVLLGTVVGDLLRSDRLGPPAKGGYLVVGAVAAAAVGWVWGASLPFNKPVWTASYILYTAGWGLLVLAGLYALVDALGWRWLGFPLVVLGVNPMVAYVGSILVKVHVLQEWSWVVAGGARESLQDALLGSCVALAGRTGGGWLYTLGYILCWWLVLLWLYHRRIFLRV